MSQLWEMIYTEALRKRRISSLKTSEQGVPWRSTGQDSAFTAKGLGSIPGEGTKILQATWCGQKINKKIKTFRINVLYWNRFPVVLNILNILWRYEFTVE